MQLLQGRVAIITGSGQGIGRAIALAYAREGARLVLASRSATALEETRTLVESVGSEVLVVPTDVRDEESVQALAASTIGHFGSIDVLVANSGVAGPTAPLWEISLQEWEDTIGTNLTGTFLCCQVCLPHMIKQQEGSIIMIGSGTGKNPLVGRTPYAASKIALVGMARTLAHDAGSYNIRVNVISPGPVAGDRIEQVFRKQAEIRKISTDEVRKLAVRDTPLRRFISADDVANMAVFLASALAASITGADMNVTAGIVMV